MMWLCVRLGQPTALHPIADISGAAIVAVKGPALFNLFRKADPRSPLLQVRNAIRTGDPALVRRVFLKFPNELNNDDPSTGCHLYWACRGGILEVVQAMVDCGAEIDLKNSRDGDTPITGACAAGRVQVVNYLLSRGCELDVSSSTSNPMFACIASSLYRNPAFAEAEGYKNVDEVREGLAEVAGILIQHGIDLTASYNQPSMVDMDASAFAYMFGFRDIAEAIIARLYGNDERLASSARAEAIEVAVGNSFSREKFRRWRYPPTRGKNAGKEPPAGEFWVQAKT